MSRRLVGIRHKKEVYIAKHHPLYDMTVGVENMVTRVDSLAPVHEPSGECYWLEATVHWGGETSDTQPELKIRVRTEECDQFVYLVEGDDDE